MSLPLQLVFPVEDHHYAATPLKPSTYFQESLYHDPWKLLVATIFLNRSTYFCITPVKTDGESYQPKQAEMERASVANFD